MENKPLIALKTMEIACCIVAVYEVEQEKEQFVVCLNLILSSFTLVCTLSTCRPTSSN